MFNILRDNERGMTLVEIIIAMALVSLILSGAFVMFAFGNTTFRGGSNQRDIQADVRFALETLTNDVRYATKLEILTSGAVNAAILETKNIQGLYEEVNPYETYIYYNENKEMLVKLQRESMETVTFKTDAAIPLSFDLEGTPESTLAYRVDGINDVGGKSFNVEARVLMLNILDKNVSKASGVAGGTGIRYITPEDSIAAMQFPNTQLIGINDKQEVRITFNKDVKMSSYNITPASNSNPLQSNNIQIDPPFIPNTNPNTNPITNLLTLKFQQVGNQPKSFIDNDIIEIVVNFGTDFEYEAYYTLIFDKDNWQIE